MWWVQPVEVSNTFFCKHQLHEASARFYNIIDQYVRSIIVAMLPIKLTGKIENRTWFFSIVHCSYFIHPWNLFVITLFLSNIATHNLITQDYVLSSIASLCFFFCYLLNANYKLRVVRSGSIRLIWDQFVVTCLIVISLSNINYVFTFTTWLFCRKKSLRSYQRKVNLRQVHTAMFYHCQRIKHILRYVFTAYWLF